MKDTIRGLFSLITVSVLQTVLTVGMFESGGWVVAVAVCCLLNIVIAIDLRKNWERGKDAE